MAAYFTGRVYAVGIIAIYINMCLNATTVNKGQDASDIGFTEPAILEEGKGLVVGLWHLRIYSQTKVT